MMASCRKTDNLLFDEGRFSIGFSEGEYVLFHHDRPEAVLTTDEIKAFIEGEEATNA